MPAVVERFSSAAAELHLREKETVIIRAMVCTIPSAGAGDPQQPISVFTRGRGGGHLACKRKVPVTTFSKHGKICPLGRNGFPDRGILWDEGSEDIAGEAVEMCALLACLEVAMLSPAGGLKELEKDGHGHAQRMLFGVCELCLLQAGCAMSAGFWPQHRKLLSSADSR